MLEQQMEILNRLDRIEKLLLKQQTEPMTATQLCKYLDISMSHLYKMTSKHKIPHYKPSGKRVYFDKLEIDKWLLSNHIESEVTKAD